MTEPEAGQAAWMIDAGAGRKATLSSSMAKRYAADIAMELTTEPSRPSVATGT